jgi:hypothetical protein
MKPSDIIKSPKIAAPTARPRILTGTKIAIRLMNDSATTSVKYRFRMNSDSGICSPAIVVTKTEDTTAIKKRPGKEAKKFPAV